MSQVPVLKPLTFMHHFDWSCCIVISNLGLNLLLLQ